MQLMSSKRCDPYQLVMDHFQSQAVPLWCLPQQAALLLPIEFPNSQVTSKSNTCSCSPTKQAKCRAIPSNKSFTYIPRIFAFQKAVSANASSKVTQFVFHISCKKFVLLLIYSLTQRSCSFMCFSKTLPPSFLGMVRHSFVIHGHSVLLRTVHHKHKCKNRQKNLVKNLGTVKNRKTAQPQ